MCDAPTPVVPTKLLIAMVDQLPCVLVHASLASISNASWHLFKAALVIMALI
jgi:hypothetical protein